MKQVEALLRRLVLGPGKRTLSQQDKRHSLVGRAHVWKMKRQFQIDCLKRLGLRPDHYLLDLGCGTLRGGIPIIQYLEKAHYYGVESREVVLEEGKKELSEYDLEGKEPVLIASSELFSLDCGQMFDFLWAFSVLIHMTDPILYDCLSFVRRHLKLTGAFYANVNIGRESSSGEWGEFPVVVRPLSFYEQAAISSGLFATDMGALHSLGHHSGIPDQDNGRMLKFTCQETELR